MVIHLIILSLIVLVLSGFRITNRFVQTKNEAFVVIDTSDSMKRGDILEKLEALTNDMATYKVGLIGFGYEAVVITPLTLNHRKLIDDYKAFHADVGSFSTNIENALTLARDNFTNKKDGRIILITDGLETDGHAKKTASILDSENIRLDVIYLKSEQSSNEIELNAMHIEPHLKKGEAAFINVVIQSVQPTKAQITFFENNIEIENLTQTITLSGGEETLSFEHVFYKSGVAEIKAVIKTPNDGYIENNQAYGYTVVDGKNDRLLLIEGENEDTSSFYQLIKDDFHVDKVKLSDVVDHNMIKAYDTVILANVSNASLPDGFDSHLKYYVEVLGGSLLTIGGDNAYQQEDMEDSLFEQILPVFSNTDSKSMAVVLVIDKSGSMITHGSEKLELAKQGAIETLHALKPNDYVGIVLFDQNPVVLVEPTPVSQKEEIIPLIMSIEAGAGTRYTGGLQLAKNMLDNFPGHLNFNKHVLFLTDGAPQDSGYEAVIQQYGQISLSTIAIGNDHGIDYEIVRNMVRIIDDRGKYYQVLDEYELPDIMRQEALSISSDYLNEERFTPIIHTKTPEIAHIIDLPDLLGYYGSRIKDGASLILRKDSDPIYAQWQLGRGMAGSFLSDLNGHYSSEFLSDIRGKVFLISILKGLLPKEYVNSYEVITKFSKQNLKVEATITAPFEDDDVFIELIDPLGKKTTLDAIKQTNTSYSTSFDTLEAGLYTLITHKNQQGIKTTTMSYITHSYSKEYNTFYNDYDVFESLKELANLGNGEMLFDLDDVFDASKDIKEIKTNPTQVFLILSMILFLLDIIMRKFKFFKTKLNH